LENEANGALDGQEREHSVTAQLVQEGLESRARVC
jgi:hypothetical protein